jgi:hypothetical protein
VALFHAILPLVERRAGLPPGPVLLPGVACFMDTLQEGEGADLWQAIASLTQGALQGGERPGGCAIFLEQRTATQFLLDARALHGAIAAGMTAPR